MRTIFPKTSENLSGLEKYKYIIEKHHGLELQFFEHGGRLEEFFFRKVVRRVKEIYPCIEEVTVHPPLDGHDLENLVSKDPNIFFDEVKQAIKVSKELDIHVNLLYHIWIPYADMVQVLDKYMKEALKLIGDSKVTLLIENVYQIGDNIANVLRYAEHIDDPRLMVCYDTCHGYINAHIWKEDNETYFKKYLDRNLCREYVKQVHFSYVRDNDGYKNHDTHGRKHDSEESMLYDLNLLKEYGMDEKIIVTEVDEDDHNYMARACQLSDLKMLYHVDGQEWIDINE